MHTEETSQSPRETRTSFRLRTFRPSPWLPGAHVQTLAGKLLRPSTAPTVERIRVDTPDGDFLDLDVGPEPPVGAAGEGAAGDGSVSSSPVVLVLHGLEGSSRRAYVTQTFRTVLRQGMRPVGMNFRGCSGEPNRTARFYHSGETGDLRHVLQRLRSRFPDRPLGAVGFSLGGNMLLKYLGEMGQAAPDRERDGPIEAAVAVSVPFDLAAGADRLEEGPMGRLYTHYFLRMLRRKVRQKDGQLSDLLDVDEALQAPTLRLFDDAATAPLHGFESAAEYYRRSSSARFLPEIRTTTLLLQARDDPFLPPEALPEESIHDNPHLIAGIMDRGGHVGFVEGEPWNPRFWAEEEAARFLAHHLHG